MIVRFGLNVYPAEMEAVLNAHPALRSAVIGQDRRGNPRWRGSLAPYKRPPQIVLLPEMPLTPAGKVVKSELKFAGFTDTH